MPNALYYGDNLEILCEHIADESVDLPWRDVAAFRKAAREAGKCSRERINV